MSAVDAVDAFVARLNTVANVGTVYNQMRNAITDSQFKQLFVTNGQVLVWQVTREGTTERDDESQLVQDTHEIVAYGWMGFQDGVSEPIFQQLIESIRDAFRPLESRTFNGAFAWSGPMQCQGPKLVMFTDKLCHYVRLVHPFQELL
jgi:hypothetical protein